jgi:hypothetical protein
VFLPRGLIFLVSLEQKKMRKGASVPTGALFLILVELQGGGVNAIAQTRGLGAIVKYVPKVSIAAAAFHLGAAHSATGI